jgi:hypothetical protein
LELDLGVAILSGTKKGALKVRLQEACIFGSYLVAKGPSDQCDKDDVANHFYKYGVRFSKITKLNVEESAGVEYVAYKQ